MDNRNNEGKWSSPGFLKPHGLTVILFAIGVVLLVSTGCKREQQAPALPPPEVEVMTVSVQDVPIYEEWVGTLVGYVNAQIRAQVTGYLLKRNYEEGKQVKKGDRLFEIDTRPFQAALDQAKGKLAQSQALREKTQLDVKRYTPLAREKAISQEELDNAVQANLAAQAQVKADEAAVQTAEINLGFTEILSPIDGLAGVAHAQIGDLVGPNGPVLTTISTIDPIRVDFYISEQSYLAYRKQFPDPTKRAEYEHELEFRLFLADGSEYPHSGKFYFAGREVDPSTGTLLVTGLLPNPDYVLHPGQFARVRAKRQTAKGVVVVPQRAVTDLQGTYQVAVVDDQNIGHIRTVKVGQQVGSNWIIEEGLKPGDRIVVEGTQKIKSGALVRPRPVVTENKKNAGK